MRNLDAQLMRVRMRGSGATGPAVVTTPARLIATASCERVLGIWPVAREAELSASWSAAWMGPDVVVGAKVVGPSPTPTVSRF